MKDINKLLNKKGWTGKELGQLEIAKFCYDYQLVKEDKNSAPLVSTAQFRKMLATLTDPEQIKIYNAYIRIHKWFNIAYNMAGGAEQSLQSEFKTLYGYVSTANALEKTYEYIAKLPVVMTEKQYQDHVQNKQEEILNPQEGIGFNLFNMFIEALEALVKQLEREPKKANPLKALKKKLEKEKVTDPRILSRYNEVMGNGYYVIDETGERSDQMSNEEWRKALLNSMGKKLENDGLSKMERMIFASNQYIADFKDDINKTHERDKYSTQKKCTWHLYKEPPEDLNKWDILEAGDLFQYYRSLESVDNEGNELKGEAYEKAITEDIEAFKKEFPEVFEAVLKDMEKYLGAEAVNTPIAKWVDTVYEWKDLHEHNYYNFDEMYLDDLSIFNGNHRAIFNGVAILKEGTFNKHWVDEKGYYKAPNVLEPLHPFSLRAFFTDFEDYADNVKLVENARSNIIDMYYFLLGYNTAIDIIGEVFDLPQLEIFKFNQQALIYKIMAFNSLTAVLYDEIKKGYYDDPELKEKKLEVLRNYFYPIDYEGITIPEANIKKFRAKLKDKVNFDTDDFTEILCYRPPEGAEL